MTNEQILEIARRYTVPETESKILFDAHGKPTGETLNLMMWNFCEEELLYFAQSIRSRAERDLITIKVPTAIWDKLKDVNTVTDLINALKAAGSSNE